MSLLSHACDGAVVLTLAMACCQVMLVMVLLSLAGDGVVEVTLVVVRCHYRVLMVMALSNLASDGAAGAMLATA
jgi:hypothetical protein